MPTTGDLADAVFCNLVREDLAYRVSAKRFPGKARLIRIIRPGIYFANVLNWNFSRIFLLSFYQTRIIYKLPPIGGEVN